MKDTIGEYQGIAYHDARQPAGARTLPGEIGCAYFDLGGEGVAYHTDRLHNEGSGALNPLDGTYLNEFRADERVGTSFMKAGIDDTEFTAVAPELGTLYIGWTAVGQWYRFTVRVTIAGDYYFDLLYSSAYAGAVVSVAVGEVSSRLELATTRHSGDPIEWRQVHHWAWSGATPMGSLEAGDYVLLLRVEAADESAEESGNAMVNLAKMLFTLR